MNVEICYIYIIFAEVQKRSVTTAILNIVFDREFCDFDIIIYYDRSFEQVFINDNLHLFLQHIYHIYFSFDFSLRRYFIISIVKRVIFHAFFNSSFLFIIIFSKSNEINV